MSSEASVEIMSAKDSFGRFPEPDLDPVTLWGGTLADVPALPLDQIQHIAASVFGIEGSLHPLTGERDQNLRVEAEGRSFVFKAAHPAEDPAVIDLSTSALLHLERCSPALPCPRVVRTREGATEATVAAPDGKSRVVRMLTWLPGRPIYIATRSAAQRAACGRLAAGLAMALGRFRHPAARRTLLWDLQHVSYLSRLLEALPASLRPRAAQFLHRYASEVAPVFPELRRQVLHNDLNSKNVVVALDDETRVTGVIDFGDMVDTALAADLAIAAAAHVRRAESIEEDLRDFLRAYEELVPLQPLERRLLPAMMAARKLSDMVIPAWHRARLPQRRHYEALSPEELQLRFALIERLEVFHLDSF